MHWQRFARAMLLNFATVRNWLSSSWHYPASDDGRDPATTMTRGVVETAQFRPHTTVFFRIGSALGQWRKS